MEKSYLVNSRINKNISRIKPSGYLSFQFDLPFQLPVPKGINLGSTYAKKMIICREKYREIDENTKQYYSSIEIVSFLLKSSRLDFSDDLLSDYLNESIEFINNTIESILNYHQYTELREISRLDLPQYFPVFYLPSSIINENKIQTMVFVNKGYDNTLFPIPMLSVEQLEEVANFLENKTDEVFLSSARYHSRGRYDINHGYYQEGLIKLQTAMEIFLYNVAKFIMIHEGKDETKISNVMKWTNFKNLIDQHLAPFFEKNGLPFGREKIGTTLNDYWKLVYLLRNEAVHEGKKISEEDALRALDVVNCLIKDMINTILKSDFKTSIYDFSNFIR